MRKVSRIFLYLSGALLIVAMISTLISIFITWAITLLNASFNIILTVLIGTGAAPDVVNGLMQFATFTSPFKILLQFLGLMGEETIANGTIMTYLIMETILGVFGSIIATITLVLPMIIALAATIVAFIAARKKAKKGAHIAAIILGAMTLLYSNELIGIFFVLGGIFGTIADSKESRALESQKEKKTEEVIDSSKLIEEIA